MSAWKQVRVIAARTVLGLIVLVALLGQAVRVYGTFGWSGVIGMVVFLILLCWAIYELVEDERNG